MSWTPASATGPTVTSGAPPSALIATPRADRLLQLVGRERKVAGGLQPDRGPRPRSAGREGRHRGASSEDDWPTREHANCSVSRRHRRRGKIFSQARGPADWFPRGPDPCDHCLTPRGARCPRSPDSPLSPAPRSGGRVCACSTVDLHEDASTSTDEVSNDGWVGFYLIRDDVPPNRAIVLRAPYLYFLDHRRERLATWNMSTYAQVYPDHYVPLAVRSGVHVLGIVDGVTRWRRRSLPSSEARPRSDTRRRLGPLRPLHGGRLLRGSNRHEHPRLDQRYPPRSPRARSTCA